MGCRELQVNDYFRMTDSASGTDVPYYALAGISRESRFTLMLMLYP
jgi:hypothetical protein